MQKHTQVVVMGVVVKGDRFLFTKRFEPENLQFHDKWQLPGGGHEFAEHPEETLHRELREEAGIEVTNVKLVPHVVTKVENGVWQGVFLTYTCRLKNEHDSITLNEEASEYGWFTLSEIMKLDALSGTQEIIQFVAKKES